MIVNNERISYNLVNMKSKSVFSFNTYKALMSSLLSGPSHRGELTRAARALGCQRSYLSRVISEELHLTPDHAFNLAGFWNFNVNEREYFLSLVEHDRAGDKSYRDFIWKKILEMKRKNESVAERTDRKSFVLDSHQATYFSSWVWSAIHFLTSIPQFQSLDELASRTGIRKEVALEYLRALAQQGFVTSSGSQWKFQSGEFHAPQDSPLVLLHHQNWRSRAMMDAQALGSLESVHYTGVQTMSFEDAQKIKELLLNFLGDASRIAGPSKPEECMALTCDLFKI